MKLKELLEDLKATIKESSKEIQDIKTELETVNNKLSSQNSRIITFLNKLEDIKQINVESATLIEEMAYTLLEDNTKTQISVENKESVNPDKILVKEKYIN